MKKPIGREALFCEILSDCGNLSEAAYKAGYKICPEIAARRLLMKDYIKERLQSIKAEKNITINEVRNGLRRVAFTSSADAVKLIFSEDNIPDIDSLDLFNIAEIKKPRGGGVEIKFFDRIKALEKLGELTQEESKESGAYSFYKALEKSAGERDGI